MGGAEESGEGKIETTVLEQQFFKKDIDEQPDRVICKAMSERVVSAGASVSIEWRCITLLV